MKPAPTRQLVLLRHAKSSWKQPRLSDFDRPLNQRGRRDAPAMAERMRRRGLRPDLVLASAAVRASQTAVAMAEGLGLPPQALVTDESLYLADRERLLRRILALDDDLHCVVLVAHNPGLTELVRELGLPALDNLPTCGYAEFAFEVESWGLAGPDSARLLRLDYPKNDD